MGAPDDDFNDYSEADRISELSFFNPFEEIDTHGANGLPHWQQPGATFFITFRLGDSLPKNIVQQWKEDREIWLRNHPKPWTTETEGMYHKTFSTKIDHWLDKGAGSCIFRSKMYRDLLVEVMTRFDGERTWLHSFVIMPNHVHVLVSLAGENNVTLERTMKAWKGVSAREINKLLRDRDADGSVRAPCEPVWGRNYFDRLIRDRSHFFRVAKYIRNNPLKAELGPDEYTLRENGAV